MTGLAAHTPPDNDLSPDVRAAMRADLTRITGDERTPAEEAAYNTELQTLREGAF